MAYPHESTHSLTYMDYSDPLTLAQDKRLTMGHRRMMLRGWESDLRARAEALELLPPSKRAHTQSRINGMIGQIQAAFRLLQNKHQPTG